MAWRPTKWLIRGELDNTVRGRVFGILLFQGLDAPVELNLKGDFHRDIRGAKLVIPASEWRLRKEQGLAQALMKGFSVSQNGHVGDMTAGLPPWDYLDYPYIEWYSEENGRVVIELPPEEVTVVGTPHPYEDECPNDRRIQQRLMANYFFDTVRALSEEDA